MRDRWAPRDGEELQFLGVVLDLNGGLVGYIVSKDLTALLIPIGIGGLLGGLFGTGQVFIERFSDAPDESDSETENCGVALAKFYLGRLMPKWLSALEATWLIATKDYSKQVPGRWKRALIGAAGLSILAGFIVVAIELKSPVRGPAAPSLAALAAMLIVPAAVFGAVLGAMTDSV